MAIDFSFPPELEALRTKVREFIDTIVRPLEEQLDESNRDQLVSTVIKMRKAAHEWGLWLPHMPKEFGGMGLGHVAMAAVSAEAARSRFGPFALNALSAPVHAIAGARAGRRRMDSGSPRRPRLRPRAGSGPPRFRSGGRPTKRPRA